MISTGKLQFESNSQLTPPLTFNLPAVISTGKLQFESNSQLISIRLLIQLAVISTGKLQFESNSQQGTVAGNAISGCDFHWKVTI